VVKDAEVVERGTHDELLANNGLYAELHEIQTIGGARTDTDPVPG
jgi:ABC-type multidrug transport system fused ATPase/permease subunit